MTQPEQAKNVFKQIFADGWAAFTRRYPRYVTVDEVVQKMLGCGDPAKGHALYLCPDCLERHVVAFSCKSQFCLSCAKVYGQTWVETVAEMLHPGVKYRHLVLTVPEAMRTLLYQHAVPLLEGLIQAARTTMDRVVAQAKRQTVTLSLHRGAANSGAISGIQSPSACAADGWRTACGWDVAGAGLCAV